MGSVVFGAAGSASCTAHALKPVIFRSRNILLLNTF